MVGLSLRGDKIKILMGGKGYIKLTLCNYSTTGEITLTDPKGNKIASVEAKANKDGISTTRRTALQKVASTHLHSPLMLTSTALAL